MTLRPDLQVIAEHVAPGSRILDVGCGDGALMAALRDRRQASPRGIEIDAANVAAAVARGLSVVQGDADTDLADYPDNAFDYAILSQTLQTTRAPDVVLDHLLRIGARAFVSFPNFAHWRVRLSLLWGGRMPVTRLLPVAWYATPNIHHVTVDEGNTGVTQAKVPVVLSGATNVDVVLDVLGQLGASGKPMIEALNKCDRLPDMPLHTPDLIPISASSGAGLDELRAAIARRIGALRQRVRVSIPYAEGAVLSLIHDGGQVIREEYTAEGTIVECHLDAALCQRVEKMLKNGHVEAVGSAE